MLSCHTIWMIQGVWSWLGLTKFMLTLELAGSTTRSYINIILNPAKVNVTYPTKDKFTQPLSENIITKEPFKYQQMKINAPFTKATFIWIRNYCFVNIYFEVGLNAWQPNMGMQVVFHEYKKVTLMCQYISKTEDQC